MMPDIAPSTIILGIIVAFGLVGNGYCIVQLRCSSLRRCTLTTYLISIALCDSGFLLSLALLVIYDLGFALVNLPIICQLSYYLSYLCCFLSEWFIVALSAERLLAVYKPFQSFTTNGDRRPTIVVTIITIVGMTLNGWPLFIFDSYKASNASAIDYECEMRESYRGFYKSISIFDSLISCVIPLLFILVCNFFIVRRIVFARKIRKSLTNEISIEQHYELRTCDSLVVVRVNNKRRRSFHTREKRVTFLLLAIPLAHIVLNAPSYLYRLTFAFLSPIDDETEINLVQSTIDTVLIYIFYTHFSINFIFYSYSNRRMNRDKSLLS